MMQKEQDVNTGLFPPLNNGHEGDATVHSHGIDPSPALLSRILRICESEESSVTRLVQAAWAVVVQKFSEAGLVQMGAGDLTDTRMDDEHDALDVLQWTLAPEERVKSLLYPKGGPILLDRGQRAAHNTAVLVASKQAAGGEVELLNAVLNTDQGGYDLMVLVYLDYSAQLKQLRLLYRRQILSDPQARNVATTLIQAVEELAEGPHRRIDELNLFSTQNKIDVQKWNDKPRDGKGDGRVILEMIRQHAVQRPEALAIDSWDGQLSYSQLSKFISHLSDLLRGAGIGPGVMVPVCFPRSMWAIVAEGAVLQAGGAFVPIDPSHPPERTRQIVSQTQASLGLTAPPVADRMASLVDRVFVIPQSLEEDPCGEDKVKPVSLWPDIDGESPAYVLFTSGSTGQPKGCVVSHGALANVKAQADALYLGPNSRALQFASYSFGVSLIEIYCVLVAGATICIPSDADRLNRLTESMQAMRISWAYLTTATAGSLRSDEELADLQTLILTGEPLGPRQIRQWAPRVQLCQGFGCTEWAGVCCVSRPIQQAADRRNIGASPTANLWLVDPSNPNRLAPVGAVGELVIEGPALTQGYLNNPERTAAAFLPQPDWWEDMRPGVPCRAYRTGDLVQYESDGSLRYITRRDTQVKVRGIRVELGEIEYQIRRTALVDRVVVEAAMPADGHEGPALVAFLHARSMAGPKTADAPLLWTDSPKAFASLAEKVRQSLCEQLPDYMWPGIYCPLSRVPLTLTGKLDRKALRDLICNTTRAELTAYEAPRKELVPPRTAREMALHRLFASVLQVDPASFGIVDSFLRLGGDSLLAMKMVNLAREQHLHELTVADVLAHKSIERIAESMERAMQVQLSENDAAGKTASASSELDVNDSDLRALVPDTTAVADVFPCSAIQEGILVSQMRCPGLYQMQFVWEIATTALGPLDLGRLERAWQRLYARHAILRSKFYTSATSQHFAVQVVFNDPSADIVWAQGEINDPKDLMEKAEASDRPRLTLHIQRSSHVWAMLQVSHAMVDAVSTSILMRDLAKLYDDDLNPEVGIPSEYRDYVSYLTQTNNDEGLQFWTSKLAGLEPCLFPKLQEEDDPARLESVPLYLEDVAGCRHFCQQHGVTLATLSKVAWGLVLRAFTGSEDVCFGYMSAGRDLPFPGIDQVVGPLINMLVCRIDFARSQSIDQALQTVQADLIETWRHQRVPLSQVQHELGLSSQRFFNTSITFPPGQFTDTSDRTSITVTEIDRRDPTEYDIMVEMGWDNKQSDGSIKYWSSLLSVEQATAIAETLRLAFSHVVRQPLSSPPQIDLVGPADVQRVKEWNRVEPEDCAECVHERITAVCRRNPGAIAIDAWDGRWTYSELDAVASILARQLQTRGIGPEVFVGICMVKSRWTPVAILATIQAGGAFALLDPGHPVDRLRGMCDQLNAALVLTRPEQAAVAEQLNRDVVVVEDSLCNSRDSRANIENIVTNRNALYAVFTSGSTGRPKGVVVEHHSFCASMTATIKASNLTSSDRMFQFASYAFDNSVFDHLVALLAGACLCVPRAADCHNILAATMAAFEATWVIITPSVARLIRPEEVPCLRTLCLTGEAVGASDLQTWSGNVQLFNLYGPAECSIITTTQHYPGKTADPRIIGNALGSVATWVVEPQNADRLVPVGAIGELLVEGPGVGRGYLHHRAGESTAPFLSDPKWLSGFRAATDRRVYQTGDLVQYTATGKLRYLGRKDTQVKISGQRVELGEIESAIRAFEGESHEAVADVLSRPGGKPILLACLGHCDVPRGLERGDATLIGTADDAFRKQVTCLENHLRSVLPHFMVPAIFMPLRYIPRSPTGKMDRKSIHQALTTLTPDQWETSHADRPPVTTPAEHGLQALWSHLIQIPQSQIWADSHFFRLGGDSLLAMALVKSARSAGWHFTMEQVFQYPLLSDLASVIYSVADSMNIESVPAFSLLPDGEVEGLQAEAAQVCQLHPMHIEDIYPCTPIQEGLMALSVREMGKYTAQWVYSVRAGTDMRRLRDVWQTVVEANPILRTRMVATQKHGVMQVVVRAECCAIKWKEASSVAEYLEEDSAHPMGLGHPLLRFGLVERDQGTGASHLTLTMHHAIYDAVSMELLLDQVNAAYSGRPVICQAFNHFIKDLMTADASKKDAFWAAEFHDLQASTFPALPFGVTSPRPSATISRNINIPRASQHLGVTLTTIFRAAWAMVLSTHTDSSDIVFGVTVSGRSAATPGIDQIAGPTVATFPLRCHIDPSQSIVDTLHHIQSHGTRIIPMEQTGLQSIQRVGVEAQAACAFQSHLLVQYQRQSGQEQGLLLLQEEYLDYTSVSSYAFELVCDLNDKTGAASATAAFDPRVLSEGDASRLLSHFDHLVQQICLDSDRQIKEIELISAEDLVTLRQWNGRIPVPHTEVVQELILHQVDEWPEKLAVSSWDGELTYRELEVSSARLAHKLQRLGVCQGDVVPLCFRKGIWPVVAMLAVLRAGGACANIDPKLPLGRVSQMLREIEPQFILCGPEQQQLMMDASPHGVSIHCVPEIMEETPAVELGLPLSSYLPSDAAFVVFTSGSTGAPKGIVIEHGNLATCIRHTHRTLRMTASSRVLQFTAYAFDVSLYDTFAPLVLGATTFIPSEETRLSHLGRYIQLHGIDLAMLIPSAVSVIHPTQVPTLQTLVLLGEPIARDVVNTWATHIHLINGYGPAEATVVCAAGVIEADSYVLGDVGSMQGTVGWIVDKNDPTRLMPLGATGELLLEGPTVTRGYLHQPDKTREAYIEAPGWLRRFRQDQQPGRLYLTGDLAQWTSRGILRFAGRKDNQIKLRGQRLELEEVVWHIRQQLDHTTDVATEVIHRRQGSQDSSLLLGFVHDRNMHPIQESDIIAPSSQAFLDKFSAIHRKLKEDLPAYMVPSYILPLAFMPRTQSGKIDRRRLREAASALSPEQLQAYWDHEHGVHNKQSPVTPAEETLQLLWSTVLGVPMEDISRHDHFFHLGGDSITAMNLASMAQRQGHDLLVAQIFDRPYLSDMAFLLGSNAVIEVAPSPFSLLGAARDRLVEAACAQCRLLPENVEDIYPTTALQEGLLAVTSRDRAQYVATTRYAIPATLDWDRFVGAWERTSQAHPILRTRIIQDSEGGSTYQVVTRTPTSWERHVVDNEQDVPGLSVRPELGAALCRCALFLTKTSQPICCVISMHHALYDEWSNHVLLHELERAYRELELLHQPFSALVAYQLNIHSAAQDFWAKELADYAAGHFPALPSATYRPVANSTYKISIELPPVPHQVTLATQIQFAWGVLVSLYTKRDDVVFGVTTSGRGTPVHGIDRILGPTIATSPRRMRLDPSSIVLDFLRDVQSRYLALAAYEHLGLQNIRRLGGSQAAACEFQSLLVINPAQKSLKKPLLEDPQLLSAVAQFTNYALQVTCTVFNDRIEAQATFDDQAIPARQMGRVLRQFEHLLLQVHGASSTLTIAELDPISEMDRLELDRSNRLELYPSPGSRMHDCLGRWSEVQPGALAVCAWDGNLTYAELDQCSTHLAAYLQSRGVVAESFVPLFFDKSHLTIVCQLAVLKAGGAFVLLDPANPIRQARKLCEQLQAKLVLTSEPWSSAAGQLGLEAVSIDQSLRYCYAGFNSADVEDNACSSSPAYAGYTSGSTGQPKVFVLEHYSVCQALQALCARLPVGPQSRVFQFAGYTFDISIMDHFLALFAGACICVPSKTDRDNRLADTMVQFDVDYACLTTSVLRTLTPADVPCVKTMVQIGGAMAQDLVGRWATTCYLVNAYGPAECALACSLYGPLEADSEAANIGTRTTGALWVVDPDNYQRLLPFGAVGELVVEGPQVGRGYHGDPEKTAASFVSDPSWLTRFSGRPRSGVRLYRTGDLACLASDGTLRCLGRKDLQVKLRGQRIDLAAVEHHTLRAFPNASDVVADVISAGDGHQPQLIAVIVQETSELTASNQGQDQVFAFLAPSPRFTECGKKTEAQLHLQVPPYMVPTLFIPTSRMPLNPNGKIDRRQLAIRIASLSLEQRLAYQGAGRPIINPTTELENQVRNIWAAVLNLPPHEISTHDNFFSIGGDSITCMQVASQCQSIGLKATAADLWEHKSIEGLTSHCSCHATTPRDHSKWAYLSPIQQLFFERNHEGDNGFNQGFTLRTRQILDPSSVRQAIHTIVGTHGMLRARFQKASSGQWQQRIASEIEQSFDLLEWRVENVAAVSSITAAAHERLNIQEGPLLVVDVIYVEESRQQYLSVVAHHLVVDTVSWTIILGDLDDSLRGRRISAPTMSFMDWCSSQSAYTKLHLPPDQVLPRTTADGADAWTDEAMIQYWDMNGISNTLADAVEYMFTLDGKTTMALVDATQSKARTQLPVIIHGCLLHAFADVFNDRNVPSVFVEGHGREPWDRDIDLTRTVGWFTTLWPATVSIQPGHSLPDVFQRIRQCRQQVPSNGWAYFASRHLHPQGRRRFDHKGPFELTFNHNGTIASASQPDAIFDFDDTGMATRQPGGPHMQRFAILEVNSVVVDGSLVVKFSVNRHLKQQDRLQRWIEECHHRLKNAAPQVQLMEVKSPLWEHPLVNRAFKQREELASEIPPGRGSVEDVYPCTPIQRGILLSQLRNPRRYNTQWTIEVKTAGDNREPIDLSRLQKAWSQVVSRHPTLRAILVSFPGTDFVDQVVLKDLEPSVSIIQDISHDVASCLQGTNYQEPSAPWVPSLKAIITRSVDGVVMITLSISHVFLDETSIQLLMRDLRLAYDNILPQDPNPSFRALVNHLEAIPAGPSRTHWAEYLHGVQPCHLLSSVQRTSNWGPESDPGDDGTQTISFDLADSTKLYAFCTEHGFLVTNIIHMVWALVLRCYTGNDDICFSFATSGRDIAVAGASDGVGLFINHLVARLNLVADSTLLQALQLNQKRLLSGLEHQHASISDLMHLTNVGGRPVFDTGISVRRDLASGTLPDASLSLEVVDSRTQTEYPLLMDVAIGSERTHLSLVYWVSLLARDTAATIGHTFRKVLHEVLRDPTQPIRSLDMVSHESKAQITQWNQAPLIEVEDLVHAEVERRVAEAPNAQATCAWDGTMTYKELDQRSSRLAAFLLDRGTTAGAFIPIYMEKSVWVPVAALATLKAGAAFCLLDVSFPQERLQAMCRQLQGAFVMTTARHQEQAALLGTPIVLGSDNGVEFDPTRHAAPLTVAASPGDPAYVVFTSGSTGMPKAAVVDHQAACSSIRGQALVAARTASCRVLQFSSHAFDVASNDLLASLMTGASLCIPSEDDRLSHLAETACRFEATWITTTPSVARLLSPREVPTLRTVVVGGETPAESDVARWGSRLTVMYGPAECCMAATIRPPVMPGESMRNVGRALPSARTWLVNPRNHHCLMPVGAVGELLIEGTSVGRGYHGDVDRSRQSFVDPPIWRAQFDLPGTHRFYRTGDLACYLPDGSLEFLGRQDSQVKLRGQRIELSDVEHHVKRAFPQHEVLVDMVTSSTDVQEPFLAAFIGSAQHSGSPGISSFSAVGSLFAEPTTSFLEAVRTALSAIRSRLPVFMVPSVFLPLTSIPMTAGGKIDRRSIRTQAAQLTNDQIAQYGLATLTRRPPATPAEERLHVLVAGVLNLSPELLGVDDDLVQRGLDSILAMKLVSGAKQSGFALTVPDIFSHPQISALAGIRETGAQTTADDEPSYIKPGDLLDTTNYGELVERITTEQPFDAPDVEDVLPTTTFQRQHLRALYRAYFVFQLPDQFDRVRLEAALQSVVRKHSILRTVFLPVESSVLQVVLREVNIHLTEYALDDGEFSAALRQSCQSDRLPGPYFTGHYFQATIARGPTDRSALVLRLSHAQFDRFSVPSLLHDLSSAYDGGIPSPRPTFRDVCAHRRRHHTPAAFSFWEELLRGSSVTAPTSPHPDAPGAATRIDRRGRTPLPPRPARFTLATLHKAAWALTLARTTGSRDLVFGQVVTGRNTRQPGVEETLGPCANAVPVRVALRPGGTVDELLQRVQSQHLQAMEYETVDFEEIVRHATSWSPGTYFGSIIQYQNISLQPSVALGDHRTAYEVLQFNIPCPCPHLTSTLVDDETLSLSLSGSTDQLDVDHADRLLSEFGEVFGRMLSDLAQEVDHLL